MKTGGWSLCAVGWWTQQRMKNKLFTYRNRNGRWRGMRRDGRHVLSCDTCCTRAARTWETVACSSLREHEATRLDACRPGTGRSVGSHRSCRHGARISRRFARSTAAGAPLQPRQCRPSPSSSRMYLSCLLCVSTDQMNCRGPPPSCKRARSFQCSFLPVDAVAFVAETVPPQLRRASYCSTDRRRPKIAPPLTAKKLSPSPLSSRATKQPHPIRAVRPPPHRFHLHISISITKRFFYWLSQP